MDLTQLSESQITLRIHCVVPKGKSEETVSKYLHSAYQRCVDNIKTDTKWIEESDVLKLTPTKTDVFILDPLEGPALHHLENYKCCVIGPMCLISSIERCQPIPPSKSPLANMAMRDMVVTLSGFDKKTKERLSRRIEMMAGHYTANFVESVTHLVSNEALSNKYNVAVERDIPVMLADWIDAVWNANLEADVPAISSQFSEFVAPPFIGLSVTLSKFDVGEISALKRLVEENGGTYLGRLQNNVTKVLVVSDPSGEKFNYAQKWKIPCVNVDWIYDSVQAHHCLPVQQYAKWKKKPVKASSSTPTREMDETFRIPDVSAIMSNTSKVSETFVAEPSQSFQVAPQQKKSVEVDPQSVKSVEIAEALDIVQLRKLGTFLDGCKIFCSGFSDSLMEKLRRICVNAGANHYWSLSDVVTHVIVGNKNEDHLKQIESLGHPPHIVTPDWLVESSRLKQPANEKEFLLFQEEPEKKNQSQARNSSAAEEGGANDILRYYVTAGSQQSESFHPPPLNDAHSPVRQVRESDESQRRSFAEEQGEEAMEEVAEEGSPIFKGLRFLVIIEGEEGESLVHCIEQNGGTVVADEQDATYVVTAFGIDQEVSRAVTSSWVLDSSDEGQLIEITKLYRPFLADFDVKPLDGCVVVFSGYRQTERAYLEAVSIALGAYVEEKFSRRDVPDKNVRGATHLICHQPIGDKFAAANKWNVYAVTGKWLLSSLKQKRRVEEGEYLTKNAEEDINIFDVMDSPVKATPRHSRFLAPTNFKTPEHLDPPIGHGIELTPEPPLSEEEKFRRENAYYCFRRQRIMKQAEEYQRCQPKVGLVAKKVESIASILKRFDSEMKFDDSKASGLGNDTVSTYTSGRQNTSGQALPLSGLNIHLTGKLGETNPEILKQIRLLGGNIRYHLDQTVTHVVHQGRTATKEVKQAKDWNIPVLAPMWVEECLATNSKVDEHMFPHTYNPNMSLQVSQSAGGESSAKKARLEYEEEKKSNENESHTSPSVDTFSENDSRSAKLDTHLDALAQMLAESAQKRHLVQEVPKPKSAATVLPLAPRRVVQETQDPNLDLPKEKVESQSLESQSTAFTWVDPEEKALQELLALRELSASNGSLRAETATQADLDNTKDRTTMSPPRRSSEPSILRGYADPGTTPTRVSAGSVVDTPSMKRSVMKRKPIVMFSMLDQKEREECGQMIRELGGRVIDTTYFCPEVTHIVIPCPMRNEKLLASIAGGRWVIHPTWLDECERAGRFVSEEPFEWGRSGCEFTARLPYNSSEVKLALAAHRWRCRLDSTFNEAGAFRDFRVILHTADIRCGAFRRLIEAGGGVVRNVEPPYTDPRDVNYVIAELDKCKSDIDLLVLAKRGIPVVLPLFLNEFLTSESAPDLEVFFPEDFLKFKSIFREAYDQLNL